MHAAFPLQSPEIWLRMLFALAVVVWAPGHLLVGRCLSGRRPLDRLILSIAAALVLPFLFHALLGRFGVQFAPLPYLGFVFLLGAILPRWQAWRSSADAWTRDLPEPGRAGTLSAAVALILILLPIVLGHASLSAPPHVGDGSNHAWVSLRVLETERLDPEIVRGDGPGFVEVLYAPGLHASAALVARVGGVAPYIATWFLTLGLLALIPAAWSLLWRAWGLPLAAVALGTLLATANPLGPSGVLSWGGFAQVAGFFMVAPGALAVAAAWRRPTAIAWIWAGVLLGGMAFLHFSEVLVALGASLLVNRGRESGSRRLRWLGVLGMLVVMSFVAVPELSSMAEAYRNSEFVSAPQRKSFGDALERLSRAGGRDLLQLLFVLGYFLGLSRPATRRVAAVGLMLGLWYLTLRVFADPVSSAIAHPFYRQAPRILYLQFYIVPPLLALPLLWLRDRFEMHSHSRAGQVLAGLLLLIGMGMGLQRVRAVLQSMQHSVPFSADDYEHARELDRWVDPDRIVANFWEDGSTWAMHVSGQSFLQPSAWRCRDGEDRPLRELVPRLIEDPWPQELSELLRREGIEWLYVSDTVFEGSEHRLRRSDFATDARFVESSRGASSSLYRIQPSGTPPTEPGSD